jgi:UDP-2,4-diacetamido-2,4,6-trideoxy-beta-L-altropyranose hydrolase
MVMKVAIITEGGKDFGMGHVFRTLTLAKELGQKIEVVFFSTSGEITRRKISEEGFRVTRCNSQEDMVSNIQDFKPDSIVFDYLDVDMEMIQAIRQSLESNLIIFDNESKANEYANTVVNALITKDFTNIKHFDDRNRTMFMRGPRYLILNRLFQETESTKSVDLKNISSLLLAFGGSDPSNRTTYTIGRISQHISQEASMKKIDIVLGLHFEYEDELNRVLEEIPRKHKIVIHRNLENLYELILKTDLVVTSPGLTMFEAMALKTPIIVMYQNELQKGVYDGLFKKIASKPEILSLSSAGYFLDSNQDAIDAMQIGKGRHEVIEAITHSKGGGKRSSVFIRQATDDDLKMIMDWRSNPAIYSYFYHQNKPLVWEEHLNWWRNRNNRIDWIIMLDERGGSVPVGSVNCINLNTKSPEVGVFVGETDRWGKSIGKESLEIVLEWLALRGYEAAQARIMAENERSRRLFETLGFVLMDSSQREEVLYQKDL